MELYIDNMPCDINAADNDLNIVFSQERISDLNAMREGLHYSLVLPVTRRNREVMGDCDALMSPELFNAATHTARIEYDGVPLIEGTVYLTACRFEQGAGHYEMELITGACRWAQTAALRLLSQTSLTCAERFDSASIEAGWRDPDAVVRFLPVIRDSYASRPSQVESMPVQQIPSTSDYHPFINLRSFVESIFADAGYSVESRFFDSELFRSLMFSGRFHSRDVEKLNARMGFRAGRSAETTAVADSYGCVYANPYTSISTVGNVVDTVLPAEGADDLWAADDSFRIEEGEAIYSPPEKISASMCFKLHYATDYRIESRFRLRGFDTIRLDVANEYRFVLANRFEDYRPTFRAGMQYRIVVFDHQEGDSYRLCYTSVAEGTSTEAVAAEFSSQSELVTIPSTVEASAPVLCRKSADGTYEPYGQDWALYGGYVSMTGRTEVEVTVRTQPQDISASEPYYFRHLTFAGAEEGQSLTLYTDTRAYASFQPYPALGSVVGMEDITAHGVRQAALLEALQRMFDLKFYTDPVARKVYVEPAADFLLADRVVDWRDRMVADGGVEVCEQGDGELEYTLYGYLGGDGAVGRYNRENEDRYGEWRGHVTSHLAGEGERDRCNELFAATINSTEGFKFAPSASFPMVGDRDEDIEDEVNFPTKILSYRGMRTLPENESWGITGDCYPLSAFHLDGEVSLCFEDRDSMTGLHRYYDGRFESLNTARRISVPLRLTAADILPILQTDPGAGDMRACYLLEIDGHEGLFRLEAIEEFHPSLSKPARCRFIQLV